MNIIAAYQIVIFVSMCFLKLVFKSGVLPPHLGKIFVKFSVTACAEQICSVANEFKKKNELAGINFHFYWSFPDN